MTRRRGDEGVVRPSAPPCLRVSVVIKLKTKKAESRASCASPGFSQNPSRSSKPEGPRSESRPHRVGLIRHRTDSVGKSAPGLGPPRSARHEGSGDCPFVRTVDRDRVRRDRSPNGVAWRVPDWTAVGFRLPHGPFGPHDVSRTLFLGSPAFHPSLPTGCCELGPTHSGIGGVSPRGPVRHWRRL